MIDTSKIKKFQNTLENWFNENGRDFPWRSPDASKYEQVLSEILLQRTKAETVAKYYSTFFARFPDWQSLGNATIEELEDVMKPLGLYKHRAKRLYTLAQGIKQRVCNMPANSEEIKETGFAGLYIANAYSLFFLNQRKPLLDVNMSRLLKRVFDPGEFKDVRHDNNTCWTNLFNTNCYEYRESTNSYSISNFINIRRSSIVM